jgi:hypothetical protein
MNARIVEQLLEANLRAHEATQAEERSIENKKFHARLYRQTNALLYAELYKEI